MLALLAYCQYLEAELWKIRLLQHVENSCVVSIWFCVTNPEFGVAKLTELRMKTSLMGLSEVSLNDLALGKQ